MIKTRREILAGVAAAGAAVAMPGVLRAQAQYPSRAVRIVVPFPAGATTDLLARLIAMRLSESMGQSFVVENVGGGGGSVGADQVAKATPDGHALLFHNITGVRSRQMKALGVATKAVALPNVPTARELGFPNLELQGWNGFLAPKGTPEPVVARLQQEIAAAVKHPDVQKRMADVGAEPSGSTQAEMREMLRRQVAQIRPVVEELKLLVE